MIFWNLESGNREIWKLPGIGWFWPISMYWVFLPLSFCHRTWFWAQNFKIPVFRKFFQKFSGDLENLWNWLFRADSNILGIIPTKFWSLKSILSDEFQNSSFPEIFSEIFCKLEIIWNLLFWANCYIFPLCFGHFQKTYVYTLKTPPCQNKPDLVNMVSTKNDCRCINDLLYG